MVLLSVSRLFLLLGYALLMVYALPTFRDSLDELIRRYDHKTTTHLVHSLSNPTKKTAPPKKNTSNDQGTKLEKDPEEDPEDLEDGDKPKPSNGGKPKPSNGVQPNNPSADDPKIRPGILTTCNKPNQFAVTFDDGPYKYTDELLNLLIAEKVKATFFVNGKNYMSGSEINPILKKAHENGFEIASHTFTHARISSLSNDQIKKEMYNNEKAIYGAISKYPAVMRPPYGDATAENAEFLNSLGYTVVTWSIDIQDWDSSTTLKGEEDTLRADLNNPAEHNIILQHDVYPQTAKEFAPKLIAIVREKNLEFVTVSECLGVDAYKTNPIQL